MQKHPKVSIVIPSLGRGESLNACLKSIHSQTYKNYENIIVTEEGPLAEIRNKGAKQATGEIVTFIDDDVVCEPRWLESIVESFRRYEVAGVSGPAVVPHEFRRNRDIFRFPTLKKIYDAVLLEGRQDFPGHITKSGTWTTGACDEGCSYEGEVDFLEACNMSWERSRFLAVGGFDEEFKGVGDWSEPDLAFRIRSLGTKLWFSKDAKVIHKPSKSGAFKKRTTDSRNRLENYLLFAKRHVKPHWRHELYKLFLRAYYAIKTSKRCCDCKA